MFAHRMRETSILFSLCFSRTENVMDVCMFDMWCLCHRIPVLQFLAFFVTRHNPLSKSAGCIVYDVFSLPLSSFLFLIRKSTPTGDALFWKGPFVWINYNDNCFGFRLPKTGWCLKSKCVFCMFNLIVLFQSPCYFILFFPSCISCLCVFPSTP